MCSRWGSSQALETLNSTQRLKKYQRLHHRKVAGCHVTVTCVWISSTCCRSVTGRHTVCVCVCVLSNRRRMSSLSTNWANFMVWWADRGRLADSPLKAVSFEAVSVYVCVWRSVRGGVCSPIVTGVVGLLQLGDESHSGGRASHCSMAAFPVWRTTVTFTNAVQC